MQRISSIIVGHVLVLAFCAAGRTQDAPPLQSSEQLLKIREDLWAEAAIRQPRGPGYEYFAGLLPPLRYVNTAFRHYPIVLSAPLAEVKARWISNGSGVNLRAEKPPMWREVGTPVEFLVGERGAAFGSVPQQTGEPAYAEGYLPIVEIAYDHEGTRYMQEAFAPTREPWSKAGAVLVRFRCEQKTGVIAAKIGGEKQLAIRGSAICAADGAGLVLFGEAWRWDSAQRALRADFGAGKTATLLVATRPIPQPIGELPDWQMERQDAVQTWQSILQRGSQVSIPEPIVQDAWRALVLGNYAIAAGDRMNYSAGNAYDHLYEGECGDAARSLLLFGQTEDARRMIGPLLDFNRQATRFHVAGHKLQLLTHYYWITRDADYLRRTRATWEPVARFIRESRLPENGLLPKDNYAGDIPQQVYSLSSNSNCWRGLRDLGAVLEESGDKAVAGQLKREAGDYRSAILSAVDKSQRGDFIPIGLLSDEPAHDPLTATRMGSYYDLMAPYVLGSGVFGPGDAREGQLIDYLRRHGGLALGMIRSMPHQGEFSGEAGVNVLYGQRYLLTILRRGDRQHALAGFYGHLAQGMTRGTFIGGEGSRFFHGDERGRSFYLPPNSAANAMFLTTLRHLLVQDWDLDDDGRPETLRLLDAIPPAWLADERTIAMERLPTAFGELTLSVRSRLTQQQLEIVLVLPPRKAERTSLWLPDPPGHSITNARLGLRHLRREADGRFDLSDLAGHVELTVALRPR